MDDETPVEQRRWYHVINPCDIDRHGSLNALGDGVAAIWNGFTAGTECACCLGFRLLGTVAAAFALGAWLI